MTLNTDQKNAFIRVIQFINDPTERFMIVSGGAGTGKTYFISQIADNILKMKNPNIPLNNVAITATTNKAAAVIAQAMPNKANEIKTVYSFMNLRVSENYATGEQKVIPTKNWMIHSNVLLIIDECSMINRKLYDYINQGLDSTCKILLVGDANQLAPVKENLSPIYKGGFHMSELKIPVRNSSQDALMNLCKEAKETVLTGKFTPIKEVPGVIDFVKGNVLKGILQREYITPSSDKRILCYTNNQVLGYNSYIRQVRGYKEPYAVGEIVSNNEACEYAGKTTLYTDQVFEIISIVSKQENSKIINGSLVPTITLEIKDVYTLDTYQVEVFENAQDRKYILNQLAKNKEWLRYFSIKNAIPDLRSVAASTTHKAQGSTYNSVIVDLTDIGSCTNRDQTARMQYVALSRAKNRIFIKGTLQERYFDAN